MKPIKGIVTDVEPFEQPDGSYRYAKNVLINHKLGSITNEKGTSVVANTFGDDTIIIGQLHYNQHIIYLFVKDDTTSKIIKFDSSINSFTTVINSSLLAFNSDYPIIAQFTINPLGETIIYWTDGLNPPRFLNLSSIPVLTSDNISGINLFPSYDLFPLFTLNSVNNSGGVLNTGVYYVGFSYESEDGIESSIHLLSNKITIYSATTTVSSKIVGDPSGTITKKSFDCTFSNLDTDYKYLRIYTLRRENGQYIDIRKLKRKVISSTGSLNITITGTESYDEFTIDDLLINKASYTTAKAMTKVEDSLYLGNLKQNQYPDLQQYVNNIKVEGATKTYAVGTLTNSFKDPLVVHNEQGFKPGEVYALYISALYKDGTESKAYHIPGREVHTLYEAVPPVQQDGSITITGETFGITPTLASNSSNLITIGDANGSATGTSYMQFVIRPGSTGGNPVYVTVYTLSEDTGTTIAQRIVDALKASTTQVWDTYGVEFGNTGLLGVINNTSLSSLFTITASTNTISLTANIASETLNDFDLRVSSSPNYLTSFDDTNITSGGKAGLELNVNIGIGATSIDYLITTAKDANTIANDIYTLLDAHDDLNLYTFSVVSNVINVVRAGTNFTISRTFDALSPGESTLGIATVNGVYTVAEGVYENDLIDIANTNDANLLGSYPEYTQLGYLNDTGSPFEGNARYFQFVQSDNVNGMAYWENQNEVYPSDFPDAYVKGTVFAGKKVRHHCIPESADLDVLCNLVIKDFTIPEEVATNIIAFKVHYAERASGNRTNYGTAFTIGCDANVLVGNEVKLPVQLLSVLNNETTPTEITLQSTTPNHQYSYCYHYEFLESKKSLNILSYAKLRKFYVVDTATDSDGNYAKLLTNQLYSEIDDSETPPRYNNILFIDNAQYLPINTNTIPYIGDSNITINNGKNTEALLLHFSNLDAITFQTRSSRIFTNSSFEEETIHYYHNGFVVDLCTYREDIYNSYEDQNLVFAGYAEVDIANFIEAGGGTFDTSIFYGGDEFIGKPFFFWTRDSNDDDTIEDYMMGITGSSALNVELRYQGTAADQLVYPITSNVEGVTYPTGYTIAQRKNLTNYVPSLLDYSTVNTIKPVFAQSQDVDYLYPTRVIRSNSQSNVVGAYREFLENDYVDIPRHHIEVIRLDYIANKLIIHTKINLLNTIGREQLSIDGLRAYIGSGDIFAAKPNEIFTLSTGFAGLDKPQHAINTPFGYFFLDINSKSIFLLNDGIKEISTINMSKEIEALLVEGGTYIVGYDPKYRRLFISRTDANTFTLSFIPEMNTWDSYHSFVPDTYLNTRSKFYSFKNNKVHQHYVGAVGHYYNLYTEEETPAPIIEPFELAVIFNPQQQVILEAFSTTHEINTTPQTPLSTFRVSNLEQDSTVIPIVNDVYPIGNTRMKTNTWFTNGFRDLKSYDGTVSLVRTFDKKRLFINKYFKLELTYNNASELSLYSIDFNASKY